MKGFKFTNYLVYWLYDHKQIAIPGIGIFNLERTPATQNHSEAVIQPPSYRITFQEDRSKITDDSFFRKLKIYSPSTSKNEYLQYGRSIEDKLMTDQKIKIDGIGHLYMKDGKIEFEQDQSTAALLTQHYSQLKMKFFTKPIKLKSWLNLKLSQLPNRFWTIYLPLISALILISSFFILKNKIKTQDQIKPKTTLEITPKENSYDRGDIISDTLLKENDTVITESMDQTTLGEDKSTINTISNGLINQEDSNITIKTNTKGQTNQGEIIRQCIIITGAYRSKMYKNLMIQRIRNAGYDVYVEESNGLTRVGLQFECTDAILADMLEKIRATFEKDAWQLVKEKE